MSAERRIGLLGGTFDPIHIGHLETASAARRAVQLACVHVLPSNVPPHRAQQPVASSHHRFAMTALAVNGIDGLRTSDIELSTPGPSFTADTLTRFLHATGLAASQIFFITGADAFAEIETWHRYPDVLDLANFIVVSRPGFAVDALRDRLPALAGRMIEVNVSKPIADSQEPAATSRSIFLANATTPDVSSSDIRQRLMAHQSIAGLVPATVERHIAQHGLYV
ncbi:MAG TPA: nicotinate-nucleotide adenylyltransferase [Vicinamibacterales bacterium]|nr:nicotinate-nucleotide adenylyltransferase [Vicinamibacterales bacterium]